MRRRATPTVVPRPRRRQPEAVQQEQGIALLRTLGATIYRLGVRRRGGDYQGTMQTAGLPDVFAFLPDTATGPLPGAQIVGRTFLVWEVKASGGRVRPEQAAFRALCVDAGVAHVLGDCDALIAWLVAGGYLRADQLSAARRTALPTVGPPADRSTE
ncbi:MAG: VRR-NUC domain-containing protein [Vicinamibacterales bacterium]